MILGEEIGRVKKLVLVIGLSAMTVVFAGCVKAERSAGVVHAEVPVTRSEVEITITPTAAVERGNESGQEFRDVILEQSIPDEADGLLSQMTLEEKVYQLFFVTPEQLTGIGQVVEAGQTTKESIEKYPVGGIVYFSQNIETREQTATMLNNLQSYSRIPVFTGVDEEGGTVRRVGSNSLIGMTEIPDMLSIGESGDASRAYDVGYTLGTECKALGFNLDFAPVADVYSNPENTVIGNRSFSTDPGVAADMVGSCVEGFHVANMICTLKHFPGHGDTFADSHYTAASTQKSLAELEQEEFLPFERGIDAGADLVMMGHILTPSITDSYTPASLSSEMVSILRNDLNFKGVIITDAMNMAAISDYYSSSEASVAAIKAGVDMILMPVDFHAAVTGIFEALENGELTETMIDEHVRRILEVKIGHGLIVKGDTE
uniref:glycoside hydrolase family 3 protein n=1 Tax=Eubacterium cellulosolvens TaxID=29322 RepID=UPI000685037C|nr:glycoside hydrolase family 3 N-terminal domain-containing protein [[Eubacterium] cellulosolvens]